MSRSIAEDQSFRSYLQGVISAPFFEWFIVSLIIVNAVILGLETNTEIYAKHGPLLDMIDRVILGVFVLELLMRVFANGRSFLKDPWSLFDLFVVGVALVPATGHLAVLRSLRILRVLRLISAVPSMRRVVSGLLAAIPGMASIVALLLLVLYVASVMATQMFGPAFPDQFGTLGTSVFTLVQIMTMEGWADISGPVMAKFSYAWVFFLIYMLVTSFAVLNLFIGIIVDAMQSEALEPMETREEASMEYHTDEILTELAAIRKELQALRQQEQSGQ